MGAAGYFWYEWYYCRQHGEEILWQVKLGPVAKQAAQSVVAISTDQRANEPGVNLRSAGSGFVVDAQKGFILTNEHVIHGADQITVALFDQRKYVARVVGADARGDIAVLKIEADKLVALPLAPPGKLAPGQMVVALGNPLGTGSDGRAVATFGVINRLNQKLSAFEDPSLNRFYNNLIQTNAQILPGSSGGPLINEKGDAVGINTAMATAVRSGQQFGFAIALDQPTLARVADLQNGASPQYAFLGVNVAEIDPGTLKKVALKEISGAMVDPVLLGGPAQEAGIRNGDVLRAINGERIHSPDDLIAFVNQLTPGATIQVEVLRSVRGQPRDLTIPVTLINRSLADLNGFSQESRQESVHVWGLEVKPLIPWRRQQLGLEPSRRGVLVYNVDSESFAERQGYRPGMVISRVGEYPVDDLEEFIRAAARYQNAPRLEVLDPAHPLEEARF